MYRVYDSQNVKRPQYATIVNGSPLRADFWNSKNDNYQGPSALITFGGDVVNVRINSEGELLFRGIKTLVNDNKRNVKSFGLEESIETLRTLPEEFHDRLKPLFDLVLDE